MVRMKRPELVVVILSAALLSSCSWAKLRYQKVRNYFHRPPTAAKTASLKLIEPTKAQQAAARRLLAAQQRQADLAYQEQNQAIMNELLQGNDETPDFLLADYPFEQELADAPPFVVSPGSASANYTAPPAPAAHTPTPSLQPRSATAGSYVNKRFSPRGAPLPHPTQEDNTSTHEEPAAAIMRGFRSPSLPNALPMDIDGKLHSPSTQ